MQITRLHTSQSSQTKTTRPLNRRIKTIESVPPHNQSPQTHLSHTLMSKQHIFINNPFIFTEQNEAQHSEMTFLHDTQLSRDQMIETNRRSQTEYEVDEISRMKLMYESRLHSQKNPKIKPYNKSIDKSPHSKSIQKHTLKPTNIPNFNKLFSVNQKPKFQQLTSTCESPNFSQQHKQKWTIQNDQQNSNQQQLSCRSGKQFLRTKFTNQNQKIQNKDCQSIQKRNVLECSGISSKFPEYQFGSDIKDRNSLCSQKTFQKQDQKTKNGNSLNFYLDQESIKQFSQAKNSNMMKESLSEHKDSHCSCQTLLRTFMQQTNNKMAQITERLMFLQNQNARLRKIEEQFVQNNKLIDEYEQHAELMQKECSQLKQSNYSYQTQKEELQLLLKQILFKREKQKYQKTSASSSKQNTQRYQCDSGSRLRIGNQTIDREELRKNQCEDQHIYSQKKGDSYFKRDPTFIVKKGIEPLGQRTDNANQTKRLPNAEKNSLSLSDSKMKMQNLLSKIQIKIQKS